MRFGSRQPGRAGNSVFGSACKTILIADQTRAEYDSKLERLTALLVQGENRKILARFEALETVVAPKVEDTPEHVRESIEFQKMSMEKLASLIEKKNQLKNNEVIQLWLDVRVVAEHGVECSEFPSVTNELK